MSEYSFLYITFANKAQALDIGEKLVAENLCACVNILGPIDSIYKWKGRLETSNEVAAFAKTKKTLVDKVINRVKKLHSYECPCVVELSMEGGNPDFLKWINQTVEQENG